MKTVLIAEDNPANRELMRAILEIRGCEVREATNGAEALQAIRRAPPDLVLMDIQMPQMGGVAALHQLRADPEMSSIPVIALTAYAMTGDKERMLGVGFDGYASKPVDANSLWRQIEQLLYRNDRSVKKAAAGVNSSSTPNAESPNNSQSKGAING